MATKYKGMKKIKGKCSKSKTGAKQMPRIDDMCNLIDAIDGRFDKLVRSIDLTPEKRDAIATANVDILLYVKRFSENMAKAIRAMEKHIDTVRDAEYKLQDAGYELDCLGSELDEMLFSC